VGVAHGYYISRLQREDFLAIFPVAIKTQEFLKGVCGIIRLVQGECGAIAPRTGKIKMDTAMSPLLMRKDEEHLIHEKIAVPDASPRVSRSRLLKLLVENVACCNATIINGRAGTGKTTLAADFARYAGRPVAWYKVDAADGDLRMFCEYLSTAVGVQRPSMDK